MFSHGKVLENFGKIHATLKNKNFDVQKILNSQVLYLSFSKGSQVDKKIDRDNDKGNISYRTVLRLKQNYF